MSLSRWRRRDPPHPAVAPAGRRRLRRLHGRRQPARSRLLRRPPVLRPGRAPGRPASWASTTSEWSTTSCGGAGPRRQRATAASLTNGVTTIVDLRAGASAEELESVRQQGFDVVQLPVTDGEAPSTDRDPPARGHRPAQPRPRLRALPGRSWAAPAASRPATRWARSPAACAPTDNLAVGPPTLEQLGYTMRLEPAERRPAPAPVVMTSRVLDAPRQLWNDLFGCGASGASLSRPRRRVESRSR